MIYKKTSFGQEEVATPKKAIGLKERQLLIMVDGKRTSEDLGKFINIPNVKETLARLANLGLIISASYQEPSKPFSYTATTSEAFVLTPAQMEAIKEKMLQSTDEHLGILGRNLRKKIEAVNDHEGMKTRISEWHMAMRDSKTGRDISHVLMDEIKSLFQAQT